MSCPISLRRLGGSTLFNGTTTTIPTQITSNNAFTTGKGYTMWRWIKAKSTGEFGSGRIMDKSNGVGTEGEGGFMWLVLNNGRLSFKSDIGGYVNSGNNAYVFNRWCLALVTVAPNGTVSHYVNNVLSGTPAISGGAGFSSMLPLTIGNRSNNTDRTFNGALGEGGVLPRVMTASEMSALFKHGAVPADTAHLWELDEVDGVFYDSMRTIFPLLEDFHREDNGSLGANWTVGLGGFLLKNNKAIGTDPSWNIAEYNTVPVTANVEAYAKIANIIDNAKAGVYVRWNGGAGSGYGATVHMLPGGHEINVYRTDAFVDTSLKVVYKQFAPGDSIGMRMVGSLIGIYHKTETGAWTLLDEIVDATYATVGKIELITSGTKVQIDSFGGGDVVGLGIGSATAYTTDVPYQQAIDIDDQARTSVSFDGVDDFITIPTIPSLTDFAVQVRVFHTRKASSDRLVDWSASGPNGGFNLIDDSTGVLGCTLYNGAVSTPLVSQKSYSNVWVEAVIRLTKGVASLWVNGQKVAQTRNVTMTLPTAQLITLGRRSAAVSNPMLGKIKTFRLWSGTVPTDRQIADLYFDGIVPRTGLATELLLNNITSTSAPDTSGLGNNGTISGALQDISLPNYPKQALDLSARASLSFDGVDDVLTIPESLGQVSEITVQLVAKSSNTQAGASVYNFRADNDSIGLYPTGKLMKASIKTATGVYVFSGNGVFNREDRFEDYVLVFKNGEKLKLYKNGVLVDQSVAVVNENIDAMSTIWIGAESITALRYAKMTAKAFRVWTSAFTDEQVASLHFNNNVPTKNLLIDLPLNEGAGLIAYDKSGLGNNGTINGGALWTNDLPAYPPEKVGGNLVHNGNFDYIPVVNVPTNTSVRWIDGTANGSTNRKNKDLFGWYFTKSGSAQASFDDKALKISLLATASYAETRNRATSYDTAVGDGFEMKPNTQYRLTFKMKTNYVSGDSNSGAFVRINMANGAGVNTQEQSIPVVKVTTEEKEYVMDILTGATIKRGHIEPCIYGHTGAGTLIMDAWFSDISLVEVDPISFKPVAEKTPISCP